MIYLLFAGSRYYPKGGTGDLIGSFVDCEVATWIFQKSEWSKKTYDHWAEIHCIETGDSLRYDYETNEWVSDSELEHREDQRCREYFQEKERLNPSPKIDWKQMDLKTQMVWDENKEEWYELIDEPQPEQVTV